MVVCTTLQSVASMEEIVISTMDILIVVSNTQISLAMAFAKTNHRTILKSVDSMEVTAFR